MDLTDSTDLPSMAGHNDELTMYIWFCCPVMLETDGSIVKLTSAVQTLVLPLYFPVSSDISRLLPPAPSLLCFLHFMFLSHLL